MSDNIFANRFYGFKNEAWHKKGFVTETEMTACDVWNAITPYWIEKRAVGIVLNGEFQESGQFALVRSPVPDDPEERILGYVAKRYNIVQPQEICEKFDENVKKPVETLGCLGKGEKLFLTWSLPKINVGDKDDEVQTYGFVASGFDGLFGLQLFVTTVRVVCQNTWMAAVAEGERKSTRENRERNRGKIWSGKHHSKQIDRDLGIWLSHVQQRAEEKVNNVGNIFNEMARMAMNNQWLTSVLNQVYPDPKAIPADYPKRLLPEATIKFDAARSKAENDRNEVKRLFDGDGTAIDATAWGLFNAVTEYENHVRTERKPAEVSVLFGARAQKMARAFDVLTAKIK